MLIIDDLKYEFKNYLSDFIDNDISLERKTEYYQSVPQKLYKFRVINDNNLKALENDYIWLSLAKDFIDITDSTIDFELDGRKKIEKLVETELPAFIFTHLKREFTIKKKINPSVFDNMSLDDVSAWLKDYVYKSSGNFRKNKVRAHLRREGLEKKAIQKFEEEILKLKSKEMQDKIANYIFSSFASLNTNLREMYHIHCFTSTYENPTLWENYAENDKGFCIEYKLSDLSNEDHPVNKIGSELFPINYGENKKVDYSDIVRIGIQAYLKKVDIKSNNKFFVDVMNAMLTKNSKYSFEEEWRLVVNKNKVKRNEFKFPFISAIYLGINVREKDKVDILKIATKKNIDVYQRKINRFNNGYCFEKIDKRGL